MSVAVLLVDDHALIRQGLRRAFERTDDLEVVGEAGSLAEARALARAHTPDVAVVDVNLGDGSGIELVAELRQQRPTMGLVVLTMYDGDDHLFAALEAGASSFVLKGAPSDEVVDAARRAQAHEFVTELPDGYDTRVGERGLTLSGGQRQRIAIARALLADPRILILDDATSSVDASTEQQIKVALREAMAGRTTFIIAHRLSTIALADEIVVLERGRVLARGTHDELLMSSSLYRSIVEGGLPDAVFLTRKPVEREVAGF